jgi:hypothetical protein
MRFHAGDHEMEFTGVAKPPSYKYTKIQDVKIGVEKFFKKSCDSGSCFGLPNTL